MTRKSDLERLAIPKKGRVFERVFELMTAAGLKLEREPRLDLCICNALGFEVYFLPAKDIPGAVASGAIHYGITGLDLIEDSCVSPDVHMRLGIGKAKMVLASPESHAYDGPRSLDGRRIGSSYVALARRHLDRLGVKNYSLVHFEGSVEVQVALGVVEAIVEITETGTSLAANQLAIREHLLSSEMVLIGTAGYRGLRLPLLIKRIERVLRGRSHVMLKFNLRSELLDQACQLSHGMSSPTVNHLAESGWLALEVAVPRADLHNLMDRLIELGAKAIISHDLSLCAPD